ncbi:MAG: hypothetical protein DCC52_12485 [Chloroflexi bacterium]|nr:MAG: hypothetical protein DCC52_12485 [Chloroflexota bacterium]
MRKSFLIFIVVLLAFSIFAAASQTLGLAAPPLDEYSAAQFDLPEKVGDYPILAVLTKRNWPCLPEGRRIIVLRTPHSSIEELQRANKWNLQFAGPLDRGAYVAELRQMNQDAQGSDCIHFGGPRKRGAVEPKGKAAPAGGEDKVPPPA